MLVPSLSALSLTGEATGILSDSLAFSGSSTLPFKTVVAVGICSLEVGYWEVSVELHPVKCQFTWQIL
jgi:hypothetical protein